MGKADDDFDEFWGKVSGDETPDIDLDESIRDRILETTHELCNGDLESSAYYLEWALRRFIAENFGRGGVDADLVEHLLKTNLSAVRTLYDSEAEAPDWLDSGRTGKQSLTFEEGVKEMSEDDLKEGLGFFVYELKGRGISVKVDTEE